ncbi:two-component sensor histidine kinase [Listeria fleischmannii 1991]|jgi:two-component system sensor histidine kinase ArlS|uniref:Signal transduction histidine-protein kinase ArlS n=3 Tax=Listeria fleischmannii TaxID=1069827 RepID=A0A2X3J4W5_9LIST|nr:HAMP domain-containing histidine kinase [Listeria fleischmannii]EIA21295.1 two-component sensor histidine kinase [Listeria fleischmannii subsp. coloradonensis]EMG27583.1 two-component sensor histidine kinase [Listeria fleischmannii subsp. fleischmannii LU2006-1]KMT60581.1 two-component sensor histidine kinase [Listeria fleischmannii 1991]MBC1399736.1 HAMP domain-containing histidine kinase [Listeria fleischmannii]MBC1419770.1 HAMP domain-containing histidine kinase [Listeria fleischmannii]
MTTSNFSLKSRSLKFKWTFGASAAIFLTFFLFSYAIYQGIGQMLLNEEEQKVDSLLAETTANEVLKSGNLDNANLLKEVFDKSPSISRKIQDQVIAIYNEEGVQLDKYYLTSSEQTANNDFSKYFRPSNERITSKPTINGDKMLISQGPITSISDNSTVIGYVQIINPLTSYNKIMGKLLVTMFILGAVALFISGMLGYLLAQNFLSPLTKLAKGMNDVRNNGFQKRIETTSKSRDEISELTVIFNDMMTRIETSFEQQKQFVEDASHELRTPVQIMEGHLKLLNRWGKSDPEVLDESLNASLTELERMKRLVQEMLDLSRAEQVSQTKELQIVSVNDVVEQVKRNFEVMYEDFTFTLDEKDDNLHAMIQHNHLEQLLIIIMDNAVKYSDGAKEVNMMVFKEKDKINISIRDHGVGISADEIDKVFNRFYRVDKARSREKGGNGLGLAIAKQLVQGYLGTIHAESEEDKGTKITITLPAIDKEEKK